MNTEKQPLYVEYIVSDGPIFGIQVVRHYFYEIP